MAAEEHLWRELHVVLRFAALVCMLGAVALVLSVLALVHLSLGIFATTEAWLGWTTAAYVLGAVYLLFAIIPVVLVARLRIA